MTKRLLMPFTHGVDMYALEYAANFAKNYEAELLIASLLPCAGIGRKGTRLEHIQQSKDYQEAIRNKAVQYGVPAQFVERVTGDVIQHIRILAQEHECEGILLFVREGQGVLLDTREVKHVMAEVACKLYIVRLPSNEGRAALWSMIRDSYSWLRGRIKPRTGEEPAVPLETATVTLDGVPEYESSSLTSV